MITGTIFTGRNFNIPPQIIMNLSLRSQGNENTDHRCHQRFRRITTRAVLACGHIALASMRDTGCRNRHSAEAPAAAGVRIVDIDVSDDDSVSAVRLIEEPGWPPLVNPGVIEKSPYPESPAMVWVLHFFNNGFNGNHAFRRLCK